LARSAKSGRWGRDGREERADLIRGVAQGVAHLDDFDGDRAAALPVRRTEGAEYACEVGGDTGVDVEPGPVEGGGEVVVEPVEEVLRLGGLRVKGVVQAPDGVEPAAGTDDQCRGPPRGLGE